MNFLHNYMYKEKFQIYPIMCSIKISVCSVHDSTIRQNNVEHGYPGILLSLTRTDHHNWCSAWKQVLGFSNIHIPWLDAWSFRMSHRLWYRLASLYVAFLFLFAQMPFDYSQLKKVLKLILFEIIIKTLSSSKKCMLFVADLFVMWTLSDQ